MMGRSSKRETVDGQRVKTLRAALRVTQGELAALLGVDRVTLARWEGGTPAPSSPTLAAALELLAAGNLPRPAEHPAWHAELFARAAGARTVTAAPPPLEEQLSALRVALADERRRILARVAEVKASVPKDCRLLATERIASSAGCLREAALLLTDDEGPAGLLLAARREERALAAALAAAQAGGGWEEIRDALADADAVAL
ncbi:MAG: helix-turn-helix transcriptional regulator [Myxococcota bacterium]|nr:helix-turn-helix transcriptional regulator [Myxococcota bacterium]